MKKMHVNEQVVNNKELIVKVMAGETILEGILNLPKAAKAIVVFAHGSGSGRNSPRNRYVAGMLQKQNFATLLFDLLTPEEEKLDITTGKFRFDIRFLSRRLLDATIWLTNNPKTRSLNIGYFGASTGAAAALVAAQKSSNVVKAIVSRGGRPDLAKESLPDVKAPTLLIVGGNDPVVIEMNRLALIEIRAEKKLVIVPGATHLFEEPGALDQVAALAADWFKLYIKCA